MTADKRRLISMIAFVVLLGGAVSCAATASFLWGRRYQHLMDFGDGSDWNFVLFGWYPVERVLGTAVIVLAVCAAVLHWKVGTSATANRPQSDGP